MATVPASVEQPPPSAPPPQGEEQPSPAPIHIYQPEQEPGLLDGMSEEQRSWFSTVLRSQLTPHAAYYFGEFRQGSYKWETFLEKIVDRFIPDAPDEDKPVMHELSKAVVEELVETRDVGTFATDFRAAIKKVCAPQKIPVAVAG